MKKSEKKRTANSINLSIQSVSFRVPVKSRAYEISLNRPGRNAALKRPRLINVAVEARKVAAITWLRRV